MTKQTLTTYPCPRCELEFLESSERDVHLSLDHVGRPYRPAAFGGDGASAYVVCALTLDSRLCIIDSRDLGPFDTYAEAHDAVANWCKGNAFRSATVHPHA